MTEKVREWVVRFYEEHNPEKVANVDALLVKYAGREEELVVQLERKYGVTTDRTKLREAEASLACFRVELEECCAEKATLLALRKKTADEWQRERSKSRRDLELLRNHLEREKSAKEDALRRLADAANAEALERSASKKAKDSARAADAVAARAVADAARLALALEHKDAKLVAMIHTNHDLAAHLDAALSTVFCEEDKRTRSPPPPPRGEFAQSYSRTLVDVVEEKKKDDDDLARGEKKHERETQLLQGERPSRRRPSSRRRPRGEEEEEETFSFEALYRSCRLQLRESQRRRGEAEARALELARERKEAREALGEATRRFEEASGSADATRALAEAAQVDARAEREAKERALAGLAAEQARTDESRRRLDEAEAQLSVAAAARRELAAFCREQREALEKDARRRVDRAVDEFLMLQEDALAADVDLERRFQDVVALKVRAADDEIRRLSFAVRDLKDQRDKATLQTKHLEADLAKAATRIHKTEALLKVVSRSSANFSSSSGSSASASASVRGSAAAGGVGASAPGRGEVPPASDDV